MNKSDSVMVEFTFSFDIYHYVVQGIICVGNACASIAYPGVRTCLQFSRYLVYLDIQYTTTL